MTDQQKAPKKPSINQRKRARQMCVQALYKMAFTGASSSEVEAEFAVDQDMGKIDNEYFTQMFRAIANNSDELDDAFKKLLDRNLEDLTPIELSILRQGTFELMHRPDVPYKVVINENVELAKAFGATDGFKYINGILDKLAQRLRSVEIRGK